MYDTETDIIMENQIVNRVTGVVLPVGNGAVGKSSLPLALDVKNDTGKTISKSKNLEFGYVSDDLIIRDKHFQVMQQYLIPPGQKESEGFSDGRNFETVIETYRFMFNKIDVVLLSFKIVEINSFNDLEFWVTKSIELSSPTTQFILVGTHLDQDQSREVSPQMITNGSEYVKSRIKDRFPDWNGRVPALEVSNTEKKNIALLRNAISVGILRSRQILT